MHRSVITFQFDETVQFLEAEQTLQLATFSVEGLYGGARVRLEAVNHFDATHRSITVDTSTEVGFTISRVFAGLLLREFGEGSFQVQRDKGESHGAEQAAFAAAAAKARRDSSRSSGKGTLAC